MDKFSELIKKGVAQFTYKPIAPEIPSQDIICRAYNNLFGAATDTHMSRQDDGSYVITGHIISNKSKFDQFLYSSMWGGVQFGHSVHSGYWSFSDFIYKNKLHGRYEILNGDDVYILSRVDDTSQAGTSNSVAPCCDAAAFTTSESKIPQNLRFLSRHGDLMEVLACKSDDPYKMAEAMNSSINVLGTNWVVANTSEGARIVGYFNNKTYIL